jgi:hypothetical protein
MNARAAAFLGLALLLAPNAGKAWGIAGHAMIADIAEWHLTPAALAQIHFLLADEGYDHLDQISSWADEIRPQRKEASPWHYVDIPLSATSYDAARDCPKGDCVIDAINRYSAVLADRSKSVEERREALKFLVHFVGDVQMPLHGTGNAGDQGGNKVLVTYFGQSQGWGKAHLNLHGLWDSGIIEHKLGIKEGALGGENTELKRAATLMAEDFNQQISKADAASAQNLNPIDWAMESHDLAAKYVYPGVNTVDAPPPAEPVLLGAEYEARAWPVVVQRIKQGGLRLAALLNRDLGS